MAPLLTGVILVSGAVLLLTLAFVVARIFQPTSVALRIAPIFVIGMGIGVGIAIVGSASLLPTTLIAPWQIIAYLSMVAISGLLGALAVVVCCIKHRVITLSPNKTRSKPHPL